MTARPRPRRYLALGGGLAAVVVAAVVVVLLLSSGPTVHRLLVPSSAMVPTIKPGTEVAVEAQSGVPRVGDIVIFHPPTGADPINPVCGDSVQGAGHPQACGAPTNGESTQTFIKRVVAGPGDRISIVNGHVIRNGVRERDPYIEPCGAGSSCNFPKTITIPPGEYFMLGDNRGESDDSRFWGPVPRSWILGTVIH